MYLARLEDDRKHWVQGVVQLPATSFQRGADSTWQQLLNRLIARRDGVPEVNFALRVRLGSDAQVDRTLLAAAPASNEASLRRLLASFTRLESIVPDSMALAPTREWHDRVCEDFPRIRTRLNTSGFEADSAWIACSFSALDFLDRVLEEACDLGAVIAWQVSLRKAAYQAEWWRSAARNLLALEQVPGLPHALLTQQRTMVERLRGEVILQDQIVGAETAESAEWLRGILQRRFEDSGAALRYPRPEFQFQEGSWQEVLVTGLHSSNFCTPSVDEVCGSAVDPDDAERLMSWQPDAALRLACSQRQKLAAPADIVTDDGPGESTTAELPLCCEELNDFLFVSYKRSDAGRVAPLLRQVTARGWKIWYDRAIRGGAEWTDVLERRLEMCRAVLLFESRAALESKWVRHEIKFAFALDKLILRLVLEDHPLTRGMNLLLGPLQTIDARRPDLLGEIDRALGSL